MKWIHIKIEALILSGHSFYLLFLLLFFSTILILLFSKKDSYERNTNSLLGKNLTFIPVNVIRTKKEISNQQYKEENIKQKNFSQLGSEGQLKDSYIARILSKIEKNKRYPKIELMMERQGYVKIQLELNQNGQISNINVLEGTNENFINEALRTIYYSAPFEPIPEELGDRLNILLHIKFLLE